MAWVSIHRRGCEGVFGPSGGSIYGKMKARAETTGSEKTGAER